MREKLNRPLWPNSRFNLTTPASLGLTMLCVLAGVALYRKGLPYEGTALVYLGGGICFCYPYYSAQYTVWMTWLVLSCIVPMSIWLQNKGVEAENWVYRPHDTYWLWITQAGEGWGRWTRQPWLGNDMPLMEYSFYPFFCLFQITVYTLYAHLLPPHWFEQPRRSLKWVFPAGFPLLLAGFISLHFLYGKPGRTDYLYWMVGLGYLLTGGAYVISRTYRAYTQSPAYWIWVAGMGLIFLTCWEFFHSCVNHDWVYVAANAMPFAYAYNGAGIPITSFFGYLTTATTFHALTMLLILRFGHIVVKDPRLVPFSRK